MTTPWQPSLRLSKATRRQVTQLAPDTRPDALAPGQVILRFVMHLDALSSWFNGYSYLDTLSHEAVKKFITVTHEAYRRHCGKHFGKLVPGIFTDEPHHVHTLLGGDGVTVEGSLPWTGPGEFQVGDDQWFEGYQLVPCGLMATPQLIVKRG